MLRYKLRRKLATVLLFALLLAAASAQAESSPLEAARSLVPATATLTESEREDGLWEFEFRDGDMRYEAAFRGETPVMLLTRNTALQGAKVNALTAQQAALNLPGEVLYAQAEKDDGLYVWKVIVQDGEDMVEYELNVQTGEILEVERYFAIALPLPEKAYARLDLELEDGAVQWELD